MSLWQWSVMVALSLVSSVIGGVVGALTVGLKVGWWRGSIESRLDQAEARLKKGDEPVGQVRVLATRIDVLAEEMREVKALLRDGMTQMVTRRECEARHAGS